MVRNANVGGCLCVGFGGFRKIPAPGTVEGTSLGAVRGCGRGCCGKEEVRPLDGAKVHRFLHPLIGPVKSAFSNRVFFPRVFSVTPLVAWGGMLAPYFVFCTVGHSLFSFAANGAAKFMYLYLLLPLLLRNVTTIASGMS